MLNIQCSLFIGHCAVMLNNLMKITRQHTTPSTITKKKLSNRPKKTNLNLGKKGYEKKNTSQAADHRLNDFNVT